MVQVRRAFPEMHIVTGAVDGILAERRLRIGGRKVELAKSRAPSLSPTIEKRLDVVERDMDALSISSADMDEDDNVVREGRKIWVIEPGLGQIGQFLLVFT